MSINGDGMIFQGAMVRALLDGTKTQTRRPLYTLRKGGERAQKRAMLLKDYPPPNPITTMDMAYYYDLRHILDVGGKVWVRENWRASIGYDKTKPSHIPRAARIEYDADGGKEPASVPPGKLRPSIFLPRWASRLTLTVTDVRIERLQDISDANAQAEGVPPYYCSASKLDTYGPSHALCGCNHKAGFCKIWEAINGIESWDANPWIVAYTFSVDRKNIDA